MSYNIFVYFDMDGVLVGFDDGVRRLCHREPIVQGHCSNSETDQLWNEVRQIPHFYAKLDPIPGSIELFHTIHGLLGDRCRILTGIPKPRRNIEQAAADKIEWVNRYIGSGIIVRTVWREQKKEFCTGINCILVDDYEKNIREWEKAGGTGILFRNPGQAKNDILETIRKLEEKNGKTG